MTRSALLLINSKARAGGQGIEGIRDALIKGGINLIEPAGEETADVAAAIRASRDQVDLVIIGGGDGTLHHALEGLVETQLPLGIVPLGTANDFARTLNLPIDPLQACDIIVQGRAQNVDLGEVNGKFFCNVASIGLAVNVTEQLKHESKSRWGVLAYGLAALKSLRGSRSFHVEIEGDAGRFRVWTRQVTVGNGRSYGGGMTVDESATATDGTLHLFSLETERWWHLIPLLPSLWRGRLQAEPNVRTLSGEHFHIRTPGHPQKLTADGEVVCTTPAEFRCIPKAIEVYLPAR